MESRKTRVDEAARLAAIHAKLPVTDVAALDNQVLVKKAAELLFAEREREANAERLAMDILAQRLEAERLARKAEEQRRLGAFQAQQASSYAPQKFEASTYSPASLPESAASLRSFAGEDPQFVERKRMQADQQAGWCAAAGASKQALAEQAAAAAAADHALLQSHFAASDVAFRAQDAARARSVREGAAANLALAFEKREGDARAAAERAATHLIALVVDDGPASGVPRTEFRGYTTQQQAEVLAGQQAQREASAARRAAEAADERSEAVTAVLVRKAQEKQTADVNAFQMQQRAAVAATVKAQRLAKEAKDKASHAEQREPGMSATYLDRFGSSAR